MSKQQTAVEWLVGELLSGKLLMPDLIEQAKQMEKKQIKLAHFDGSDTSQNYFDCHYPNMHASENYYQANYGGDHE
jgi:hypothetical protein